MDTEKDITKDIKQRSYGDIQHMPTNRFENDSRKW